MILMLTCGKMKIPDILENAFVGRAQFSNITSDELSTADRTLLKENSFDELYEHVWEHNHIKPISENDNMLEGFKTLLDIQLQDLREEFFIVMFGTVEL